MRRALAALLALAFQEPAVLPGGVRDASALYPCARPQGVVRFFHLENDAPEMAKVNAALRELGAEVAHGPRTTSGWPGHSFLALRAPSEVEPKKLEAALRKGGGAAEELSAVAFDGRQGSPHDFGLGGYGVTTRDMVRGISSDVVWYEARGTWSQFYGKPGKLKPAEIAKRYAKLYEPYGGARLGEVVKERFAWTLLAPPAEKARLELLKLLEKTACVESATIEGATLTVTVKLEGLASCADAGALPGPGEPLDAAAADSPRVAFDPTWLYDALKARSLVP